MNAGNVRRFEFDSGGEYLAACRPDPVNGQAIKGSERFTGTADYDSAVSLARSGWTEGLDRIAKLTDGITAEFAGRIMREEWLPDVVGNYLDIGKYLSGEPDCWNRIEEVETHAGNVRPHVTILYNGAVSCNISHAVIEARGSATAALVDLLELAGYSVTLKVAFAVVSQRGGKGETILDVVTVKPATERADLASIMYWTAHPSALRRIAFAHWESFDGATRHKFGFSSGGGYAYPTDASSEPSDIYIKDGGSWDTTWSTVESTRNWIADTLKKLGVSLAA